MGATEQATSIDGVRQLLERIRAAWTEHRFDDLANCFHERMVIAAPGFQGRAEGRALCVKSFSDFMSAATLRLYEQEEPVIDECGDTAVASYRWHMVWEMGGESHDDSGHDLFVCSRQGGRWWAVWRTMIFSAGSE